MRAVGMRNLLSVLGVFVIVTFATGSRCNEVAGPAPAPTPTPSNSTSVPVVKSAEREIYSDGDDWLIHGYNFGHYPSATFESGGSAIRLLIIHDYWDGLLLVRVPGSATPGPYKPCVTSNYGKGCGEFLVTVP